MGIRCGVVGLDNEVTSERVCRNRTSSGEGETQLRLLSVCGTLKEVRSDGKTKLAASSLLSAQIFKGILNRHRIDFQTSKSGNKAQTFSINLEANHF